MTRIQPQSALLMRSAPSHASPRTQARDGAGRKRGQTRPGGQAGPGKSKGFAGPPQPCSLCHTPHPVTLARLRPGRFAPSSLFVSVISFVTLFLVCVLLHSYSARISPFCCWSTQPSPPRVRRLRWPTCAGPKPSAVMRPHSCMSFCLFWPVSQVCSTAYTPVFLLLSALRLGGQQPAIRPCAIQNLESAIQNPTP